MALFRQFCSLEKANSSRKTNVYRCLTCRKDPGYYSSRFNDQFLPSLPNSGALWFCGSTKKVYRFLPPRGLKGQCHDIQWFFALFLREQKMAVARASVADMKAWPSARPGSLATDAGCWHDSAVNQRQVELELHCFTCRRRQAALLFSGYEARARWYPLLQGSRLAATAISISILYSRVWFCAPSEACFGDLVAESMGDWEKESAVWS